MANWIKIDGMDDPQTDPKFLKEEAYSEASALDTRTRLQEEYRTNPKSWFSWLYERLSLPEQARVLELGSGPGDLWQRGPETLPLGWQILLSDLSQGMSAEARRRLGNRGARFLYFSSDSQDIPCPSESCTTVIANGLLDHVPDRGRALREIQRVLEPGGTFYTSTGSRTHLEEIANLVRPFLGQANYGGSAERFGLENGARLLSPWFCEVQLYQYSDELVFDRPQPVLEYVLSEPQTRSALTGSRLEQFKRHVSYVLKQQSSLRVHVNKGLFVGRKL